MLFLTRRRLPAAIVLLLAIVAGAIVWRLQRSGDRGPAPVDFVRTPDQNVLIVTIDTLRADHLGFAGYPRDTSPHLDALAREGTAFARCYSVSATTGASHASLFTSLYPHEHGVLANRQRFPRGLATLMRALRGRGYRTAGFVSSVVVGRKMGLQDEFDHFDDQGTTAELNRKRPERPAADTLAAAEAS
jgi:arylsulfatase A-like enzyme